MWAVIVATGAVGFKCVMPKYRQMEKLSAQFDEQVEQNNQKKRDIQVLKDNQTRIENDATFAEMQARRKQRIFHNEVLIISDKEGIQMKKWTR